MNLANLDIAIGMSRAEVRHDPHDQFAGPRAGKPHAQSAADAARGIGCLGEGPVDTVDMRAEALAQLLPDRCEHHPPARPLEQRCADASFQRFDQLTDSCPRNEEPVGGPPEMELLGQRQERLQFLPIHPTPSPIGKRSLPIGEEFAVVPVRAPHEACRSTRW
nr:hypothetical protein [Nocardia cyriacigeorgica]